jgi:hypothetical protein
MDSPITAFGEIHGQWHELQQIFRLSGGTPAAGKRYVVLVRPSRNIEEN